MLTSGGGWGLVGGGEGFGVVGDEGVDVGWVGGGAAQLVLVQEEQEDRADEGEGGVAGIGDSHFAAGDMRLEAFADGDQGGLEDAGEIGLGHAGVGQSFGEAHGVKPVQMAVSKPAHEVTQEIVDRLAERSGGGLRDLQFCLAPDETVGEDGGQDLFAVTEVVPEGGDCHPGGRGETAEAGGGMVGE